MSRPVDVDLLARFVLREVTDAEHARVTRLVKEDPAWAAELRRQALLDVQLHEAFDSLRDAAPAPVVDRWAWLRGLLLPTIPVLALGAALLVLLPRGPSTTWTLEVHAGEASVRGAVDAPLVLRPGSALDLVLRASAPTSAHPEVEVRLDGAPVAGLEVRPLPGGSVRVLGRIGEAGPPPSPGRHTLTVRVDGVEHALDLTWESGP